MKKIRKDLYFRLKKANDEVVTRLKASEVSDKEINRLLRCVSFYTNKNFRNWHEDLVHKYISGKIYNEHEKLMLFYLRNYMYHELSSGADKIKFINKLSWVLFNPFINDNGGHYVLPCLLPGNIISLYSATEFVGDFWEHYRERYPEDMNKVRQIIGEEGRLLHFGDYILQPVV